MSASHLDAPIGVSGAGPSTVAAPSRAARITGRVLSGIGVLFLTFDFGIKLANHPSVATTAAQIGWPASAMFGIGVLEAVLLVLYLVPRTSLFGTLLWTGHLGGAVATHARVGNPLFSHVLFPVYIAALLWGGLYLRNARLRALVRAKP